LQIYIALGLRLFLRGGDVGFLWAGARPRADFLQGLELKATEP
jgi:hypothetical protein